MLSDGSQRLSCANVGKCCFLPATSSILAGEGKGGGSCRFGGLSHPSHPASAQDLLPQPQVPLAVPGLQGRAWAALPAFLAGRGYGTCV